MKHAIHRVTAFRQVGEFTLHLAFADGTEQVIDFRPILTGEIYGALSDPALFGQVSIDPEVHTLVWPNGADFDPAELHDWPRVSAAFAVLAQSWSDDGR